MPLWWTPRNDLLVFMYGRDKIITLIEGRGPHIAQDEEFVNTMRIGILPEVNAIRPGLSPEKVFLDGDKFGVNDFEKYEIMQFPRVYTFGAQQNARFPPFSENDFYQLNQNEHIAYRYWVRSLSGWGTYSQVVYSKDYKTDREVAIKMMRKNAAYLYAETKMLLYIQQRDPQSEFCVKLLNFGTFRGHLYLVLEPFQTNLQSFIKGNHGNFTEDDIIKMTKSLLRGLRFLAVHEIIHADLKPANILLNGDDCGQLKIADFGLSVLSSYAQRGHEVQTLGYRAPEIFCDGRVTCAIDMWSLGCILMELTTATVIPRPQGERPQFFVLLQMFGLPPKEFFNYCPKTWKFFVGERPVHCYYDYDFATHKTVLLVNRFYENCSGISAPGTTPFDTFIRPERRRFIPLLGRMFQWTPTGRISPSEALYHAALNNEHDVVDNN